MNAIVVGELGNGSHQTCNHLEGLGISGNGVGGGIAARDKNIVVHGISIGGERQHGCSQGASTKAPLWQWALARMGEMA